MAGVLVAGFAMTSCSPEDFTGANGNIPQASDYTDNFKVTVDQTTNYANFEFTSAPGVSPIWIIDGAYQASYGFSKYYRKKGSYTVECKVKNANGISDGSITKTFEIEKTIMNGFGGFVEDSEFNMFKGVTFNGHLSTMLQDGGRLQIQNILIRMVHLLFPYRKLLPISGKLRCMWNWIR